MRDFGKDVVAGTAGGMAICIVGHPFDTVKVRLQTQSVGPGGVRLYNGVIDCVKKTIQWEGPQGFYKGVTSPLMGQMFLRAVMFSAFGVSRSLFAAVLSPPDSPMPLVGHFAAGALTGLLTTAVESPIDLFKSQVQVQIMRERSHSSPPLLPSSPSDTRGRGVVAVARAILSQRGIAGAYQGASAALLRNIPANGIYFGFNELMRQRLAPGGKVEELSNHHLLLAGGVAGFGYWFLTYPTDVIKSAMQADDPDPAKRKYEGIRHCIGRLYAEQGTRRFFRGMTPCMLRSVPANATMWLVFERARRLLA